MSVDIQPVTLNLRVDGSIPSWLTTFKPIITVTYRTLVGMTKVTDIV